MPQKDAKTNPNAWDPDEAEELRRLLQSDNIAPVDSASFGKRLGEIIQRATTDKHTKHTREED